MLALFVALGGTAYAAGVLPLNSVGTAQLKAGSVTSGKVKDGTLKVRRPRGESDSRRVRSAPQGPAGPAGPAVAVDTAQVYTRAQSDTRYLRGGLVTVISSISIRLDGEPRSDCDLPGRLSGHSRVEPDASDNERMLPH